MLLETAHVIGLAELARQGELSPDLTRGRGEGREHEDELLAPLDSLVDIVRPSRSARYVYGIDPDADAAAVELLEDRRGDALVLARHGFAERVVCLAFSHDSKLLACGGGAPTQEGELKVVEVATGKEVWSERLSSTWSSVLASGDRLYVPDKQGATHVVKAAPKFEPLAKNPLGEGMYASLAASDGEIFVRTFKALWCISEKK